MQKESNLNLIWGGIVIVIILVAVYFLSTTGRNNMSHDMGMNDMDGDDMGMMDGGNKPNPNQPQNGNNTNTPTASDIPSDSMIMSLVNVSSLRVPQTAVDVALSGGSAMYKVNATEGKVTMGSLIGKYSTEDGYDVLVSMSVKGDVSKATPVASTYVALYHLKNNKLTYTSAVRIGDNVTIQSADAKPDTSTSVATNPLQFNSALGYDVTVKFLGRNTGQPTDVAPTVSQELPVNVKKHIITR